MSYLLHLLDRFHRTFSQMDENERFNLIMNICRERAQVTGFRQKLWWNREFQSWEVRSIGQQPLPELAPYI